jgi:hypothetical protein
VSEPSRLELCLLLIACNTVEVCQCASEHVKTP